MAATSQKVRVAVTGMGIVCALGNDYGRVLANMRAARTGITQVQKFPTDRFHSSIGAEVKDLRLEEQFKPEERRRFDICAQYAIVAIRQALADSGLVHAGMEGGLVPARTGLAFGTCNGGIASLEEQWTVSDLDIERTARYPYFRQGDDTASYFGLGGPVVTMNTACAASGGAIGYAYDMIRLGYAEHMIAGGSDPLAHTVYAGFNVLRALNPEPASPYGSRYGLSLGEGASFVVLEPLERALTRGAHIYAEICGYGLSNDAHHETASHPDGAGIRRAVEMALRQSETGKDQIGYINSHGTGTQANDRAEISGLHDAFGERFADIPLSSSKAYFGHTLGAAAAIELTTSLYAIGEGLLPATLHLDQVREGCESARMIGGEMIEGQPAYMLCNNSAFGGHNSAIIARVDEGARMVDVKMADTRSGSIEAAPKRVGIVGIGTVIHGVAAQGSMPLTTLLSGGVEAAAALDEQQEQGACDFSLKAFDGSLYERRMNRLSQFTIGAAGLAMRDAGWPADDDNGEQTGFIYGTSRGSCESIGKYLRSIFDNGPEFASSIYFPYNVVNSTAGKTAEKLRLKGFSGSFSTGGSEGLMGAMHAYEAIRSGVQRQFLVGAGDEFSELSASIDRAIGLRESAYFSLEGSCCIALAEIEEDGSTHLGDQAYAEVLGFGTAFGREGEDRGAALASAIREAVARSAMKSSEIGFTLIHTAGRKGETEQALRAARSALGEAGIPIRTLNDKLGYGESVGSLLHVSAAVDMLQEHAVKAAVIACTTVGGGCTAMVIGRL